MLRRNLYFAPPSVKCKAYKSCVLPILEYANICWAPTSEKLNNSIEMVQHRAAKFIVNAYSRKGDYKHFSISKLLHDLKLDTLEERRTRARLVMAYKILNGHVILNPDLLPKFQNQRPMRECNFATVGPKYQLMETQSRLKVTESTFFYAIPPIWNEMVLEKQAEAPSIDAFKKHFDKD